MNEPQDAGQPAPGQPDGAPQSLTATTRLPRVLSPFAIPAYRFLAGSLLFGSLAQGIWLVAIVWEVFRLDGGARELSIVSTAAALGIIIPALLAGVVADRVPQKRILIAVALAELAGMAAIATAAALGFNSITLMAVISFLVAVAMAFYYPAYSAMLPAIVPPDDLMAVNGFEGMVRPTVGQAIGPAFAGIVVGAAAPSVALALAAGSMVLALAALAKVPLTEVRRDLSTLSDAHPVRSTLNDIGEGFRYMVQTRWLLYTLLAASVMVLAMMGPIEVLIPVMIKEVLDGNASQHSWVLAAFGIGGAIGSLVMASFPMPRRYLTVLIVAWGLAAFPMLIIAAADHVAWMVAATALTGILFSAPMVIWGTLLQRRVPPELLGRVSSLDFFVSSALMPVSMALVGPVSDLIGIRTTFVVAGVVPVVVGVLALWAGRMRADELANPIR